MRRCLALMLPALLGGALAKAQLVNDGATITIQPGALLFCAGNVENKNSGTITNNGKLEVQGNFLNSATYNNTVGNDDSLIFSGGGNVTVDGGSSVYNYVHVNKTAVGNFVTLTNNFTIGTKLTYNGGTFSTDPINTAFTLNAAATVPFEFTAGREIIGRVRRTSWAGAVSTVFNQPNMTVATNGGTSPTEFTVNMIPEAFGGDPTQAEREVKRKFVFSQVGGSGYTADAKFPYATAELNTNTEANLVPWNLPAGTWTGRLTPVARDAGEDWVSTTGIPEADVAQEWKLADPKYTMNATALLRGPWNSGGGVMNASMNGILPLNQPYNITPFNYTGTESVGAIPNANVVDWVLVELRKPNSGLAADAGSSTIIGRKAGFLLTNGTVVDLDGVTPISFDIAKQGSGFMVVRHRNHLGVMSVSLPSNASGSYTNDFRVIANTYDPGTASEVLLAGGLGYYGLWAGDANKNGVINVTDVNATKIAVGASASGYLLTDINMSNSINVTDVNFVKIAIGASAAGNTPARPRIVRTNLPDEIGPDE